MTMNNHKVVLGMDFFDAVKAIIIPTCCLICIMEKGATCMAPAVEWPPRSSETKQLSAIQIAKGGESTLLVTSKEETMAKPTL
ncbi:hypothetical protein KSP40_PGU005005 [Platanthera guangdongensis]|uniref:Uncharacterized protein n=1 Tax=Platanthera guangdongensis TaxID=2320717 RepID=A0ABR2LKS7_9ASPA